MHFLLLTALPCIAVAHMRGVTSNTKFLDIAFLTETDVDETIAREAGFCCRMVAYNHLRVFIMWVSTAACTNSCLLAGQLQRKQAGDPPVSVGNDICRASQIGRPPNRADSALRRSLGEVVEEIPWPSLVFSPEVLHRYFLNQHGWLIKELTQA